MSLNVNPKNIMFDRILLINKDLLNTDDYNERVKLLASIDNADGWYHLFDRLVEKKFLNSKNFYTDIEKLKKASSAKTVLWIIDNPSFINSPYHDENLDILILLQEYRDINGIMDSYCLSSKEQVFSDGFMNIKITYDYYGRIRIGINIEKSIDPDDISTRKYASRDRIQDIIDNNKLQILKKVVVDESVLDEGCQKILKKSKSRN